MYFGLQYVVSCRVHATSVNCSMDASSSAGMHSVAEGDMTHKKHRAAARCTLEMHIVLQCQHTASDVVAAAPSGCHIESSGVLAHPWASPIRCLQGCSTLCTCN